MHFNFMLGVVMLFLTKHSLYASNASPFAEEMQRAEMCDLYACIGVCIIMVG